ncbi:iron-containing alcohol dehydrogenase [Neptunomonas antarctica]|uniref:Alcohol dehydrogenase, class IV n=1 Tax=Neptunomonas antarctica TaxID=619304 RepID=A0A1N7L0M9_9GAMM|nr:iron-containing alcohol dehydrogenase [Neptunomonas antarctica]SIS67357.1 Alcohol dehydrogenase, class IV [Neptunomonas antarctica]
MNGFVFNFPKQLICKAGAIAELGDICQRIVGNRVLVVTDQGIVKAGLLQPALDALASAGVEYFVFDKVEADPAESIVLAATQQAITERVNGVIGLGGGSSMDVAKLVALLATGEQTLAEIYGVNLVQGQRLPLIQIPTTAGTGSEVTTVAIITVGAEEKKGVVSAQLMPDLALLDAELTLGLPPMVTATTGVDAMVHAIEAFTSLSPNHNPLSDALAKDALLLLGANIEQAVHNGSNLAVRGNMLLGSMLAGQAFANSPVAAVHALAYPLGGIYHLSHGLTNALVLPHVMRFNQTHCADQYATLAPLVFPPLANIDDPSERSNAFINALDALNKTLGMQPRLRDYDIPESALPRLASEAMKQTRLLVNNPREVTEADALAIYQAAW